MSELKKTIWTLDKLREYRADILRIAAQHGASNVRVFGSVARGEAMHDSDVDLLMQFRDGTSLFELSALWQDLQDLLGCEVNVLSENGLRDRFADRIADDIVAL